jgi:hypothetical protein
MEGMTPKSAVDAVSRTKKFDFKSLKITEDMPQPVTRPAEVRYMKPKDFFRIMPAIVDGKEWRLVTNILEVSGIAKPYDGAYIVSPNLWSYVREELKQKLTLTTLYVGITYTSGSVFITGVPVDTGERSYSAFHSSRVFIYELAVAQWVKMITGEGEYIHETPRGELAEPVFPDNLEDIYAAIELAFRDKLIDDIDHVVLKRIRGDA